MPFGLVFLVFAFTFTAVVMAVFIGGQILDRPVRSDGAHLTSAGDSASLLKSDQLSSISIWQSLLARFDFVEIMRKQMVQADLNWSAGRLTLSMLLSGAVVYTAVASLGWFPAWATFATTWLAALAPYMYVLRLRSRRFRNFAADLPDALDSMSRALRTGYPLTSALDVVARENEGPVAAEFRKTHAEVMLGITVPRSLENLADRVPLAEVDLFAAAVQLHSRTGGRLTDVLSVLAENIREQTALQGEVRSMAAQGRVTGTILTAMPVFIAMMMAVVSPTYIGVLLAHPYGRHMIAAAIFCLIAAHFIIRRIVDIRI